MHVLFRSFLLAALLLPAAALADLPADKLYAKHCAKCHGADGRANNWRGVLIFAQDFSKPSFQNNRSDEEILDKINRGPRIMPSYAERLSRNERLSLVKYIRGMAAETKPAPAD